ncbi:MAG: EpsG family protein [Firmicutes bacterium]|nr:EpsG family protein [Bacillota bacterium]
MVRLAILLVLLCLTAWEWRAGVRKSLYWLAMAGLFIFFSLRYGQGTDYLTYLSIYANVPPLTQFPNYFAFQYNKIEIGFFYLMSAFRMLGAHYVLFISIVTFFSFVCLHRFIKRFCGLPMFALTLFFAVYSLTYVESAIRQLLALGIMLGFVYPDWTDGRRLRPTVLVLLASLLHNSAIVLLLLPILFRTPRPLYVIQWRMRKTVLLAVLLCIATAVVNFVDLTRLIAWLPARLEYTILSYYAESGRPSLLALLNRTLFMAVIFTLAWHSRERLSAQDKFLFNLYCVGYAFYMLFMSFDLIASRVNVYFRVVEVALLPLLFHKNRDLIKRTLVAMPVTLALLSFLYVKDMAAIMNFAEYYESSPLRYPYITVFNVDDLLDNKFVNVKNAAAMNAYRVGGSSWDEYYNAMQRKPSVRSPIVPY